MFDAARNPDAVGRQGNKLNGVAQIIAPQAGIAVDNQNVIDAYFYFRQRQATRILGMEILSRLNRIAGPAFF